MTAWQEGSSSTALAQIALNSRLKFGLRARAVKIKIKTAILYYKTLFM